jgi:hypothetical protein
MKRPMQNNTTIYFKSHSHRFLSIMILFIVMILPTGCSRHWTLSTGEVKTIKDTGVSSPLLKPGETRGGIVKVENVTVPG